MNLTFEGKAALIHDEMVEYLRMVSVLPQKPTKIDREVLMDIVGYIEYRSNSGDEYYIVTTVENEAVACTCKGFHFRKECSHIEGYNGSRT